MATEASHGLTQADLVSFEGAVAGHDGVLASADGDLVIKPSTQAEIDFYETCVARNEPLVQHMPHFMGTLRLSTPVEKQALVEQHVPTADAIGGKGKKLETDQAIVLENAAAGFVKPNIMDLKLGSRLWDDDALPAKRQRLDDVASKTTSGSLGFRIAGMRVWDESRQYFTAFDKKYGRQFDATNVSEGFKTYLGLGTSAQQSADRKSVLHLVRKEIEDLRAALEVTELRMYSASVLIVFEGDAATLNSATAKHAQATSRNEAVGTFEEDDDSDSDSDSDSDELAPPCRVVMIDFAHATFTPGRGRDENVLHGIDSVLDILEKLHVE